jgi:hypothetical protein
VIEKHLVARLHRTKVISSLEIADASPIRLAIRHKLVPGIGSGFLLNQPVLTHFCKYSGIPAIFELVCLC